MKVATFERRGVWPFRRWEQTGEFDECDGCDRFWAKLEQEDPALADKLRLDSYRDFVRSWMIWAGAKRGRDIAFIFDNGKVRS